MNVVIAALLKYFDTYYLHIFLGLLFVTYFSRFDIEKAFDKTNIFVTNATTLTPITQRYMYVIISLQSIQIFISLTKTGFDIDLKFLNATFMTHNICAKFATRRTLSYFRLYFLKSKQVDNRVLQFYIFLYKENNFILFFCWFYFFGFCFYNILCSIKYLYFYGG